MEQLFEFATNHWELCTLFVALLGGLYIMETGKGGAGVNTMQATLLVNREDAVLLDIRQQAEYKSGFITNAINIPAASLQKRIGELEKHKAKPIIVVCKTGTTASASGKVLRDAGFGDVRRLIGGMTEWKAAGLPVVKK